MIKPILDRVIILPKTEDKTESGIILTNAEKPNTGEVIAIGNGDKVGRLGLKVGDTVIYEKLGGSDYKEFKILNYDEIFAVIVKN